MRMGMVSNSSAWYYGQYRPCYPTSLFDYLVEGCGLRSGDRIIDVGCGTGRLAIPLAERGYQLLAIDSSNEMLNVARAIAAPSQACSNISWMCCPAEELVSVVDKPVRLVIFGKSFHLTNRPHVLRLCNQVIEPQGCVAVVSGGWISQRPWWLKILEKTAGEFATNIQRPQKHPPAGVCLHSHAEVLRESDFLHVDEWSTELVVQRTLYEVLGFQYSMAKYPPAAFSEKLEQFETSVCKRLLAAYPEARFDEHCFLRAIVGRRKTE